MIEDYEEMVDFLADVIKSNEPVLLGRKRAYRLLHALSERRRLERDVVICGVNNPHKYLPDNA